MWCFLQNTQAHLSCSRSCFGGETSIPLCLIMWSWFFSLVFFSMESPQGCFSDYFLSQTGKLCCQDHLDHIGKQQHHPSGAIASPGLLQGALKSTAVLRKLSLKIQGKGEREGKKMPYQRCLCLKDDQCFSGVNYIYVFTWAGRKTAEANCKCWQPQFWVWECGYCFLLFTCCNSSNKPKEGQGKQPNKKPQNSSVFFSLNYKNSIWLV